MHRSLLTPVFVVLAAWPSCAVALTVGLYFAESAPLRSALGGVIVLSGAVCLAVIFRSAWSQLNTARRYLSTLCTLDYREFDVEAGSLQLPSVTAGHPLHQELADVLNTFVEQCQELQHVEHTRAAQEIRARRTAEHEKRTESILAGLTEPVLAIDKYNELVLANPSAEKLFEFDSRSSRHQALASLIHCERLVELLNEMSHRRGSASRTKELELTGTDGQTRWYSVTASNIQEDESGDETSEDDAHGAVVVLREISSQKNLQQRNAEFVSSVSHEMKTPLSCIKAYTELLTDGDAEDRETQEEFLGVIDAQANRLQRLIDNMLNLARIEAGVVKVSRERRPLNELLQEAFQVVQPSAEPKNINLVADLSPLYLGVFADRDMLIQAAINLLSNAIKYTPEGGTVTLRSRMADQEILFQVEDSGVGLSEEDAKRVFDKFYRVKKDSEMAGGTGLGLPLVKHIVEDVHNGRLEVTSELDKGSIFSVFLPAAGRMDSSTHSTPREESAA